MRPIILAVLVLFTSSSLLTAQSPATFEVASVKRSPFKRGDAFPANSGVVFPGGRWSARNTSLSQMVRTLYGVERERIAGAPPWFDRDLFVVEAKAADAAASHDQVIAMAKRLLAERFDLRLHIEHRTLDIHALVIARRDGRLGPGLRPTTCDTPVTAPSEPPQPRCGFFSRTVVDDVAKFQMTGHWMSTLIVLHRVEQALGASVIDRTGLTGRFDIDLEYVEDRVTNRPGPSVLAAIEEQLGLRIERRREVLDVIVIDSADPPTAD